MSRWEHRYLGDDRFPEMLSALEIEHFFTLDQGELASVRERRGPLNRLALALQIGFLKMVRSTRLSSFPRRSSIISAGTSIAYRRGLPRSERFIAGALVRAS